MAVISVPLEQIRRSLSQTNMVVFVKVHIRISIQNRSNTRFALACLRYNLVDLNSDCDEAFRVDAFLLLDEDAQRVILEHVDLGSWFFWECFFISRMFLHANRYLVLLGFMYLLS